MTAPRTLTAEQIADLELRLENATASNYTINEQEIRTLCDMAIAYVALRERVAELESERGALRMDAERLRDGLRWYADGHHFDLPGWEDCSGESSNWIFPPESEESWMVDDGGVARSILDHGHRLNPNHAEDDEITLPPVASIDAARADVPTASEGKP